MPRVLKTDTCHEEPELRGHPLSDSVDNLGTNGQAHVQRVGRVKRADDGRLRAKHGLHCNFQVLLGRLLHALQAVVDNGGQVQVGLVNGGALQDAAMCRDKVLEGRTTKRSNAAAK